MNLNKVQLIGRVTKMPEQKSLPSGKAVAKFGIATNHKYKNSAGENIESAQFHNCVAFGKMAEIIGTYIKKGQEVYVEGRLEYRQWAKKDGTKGYMTEIVVGGMQMGQNARGSASGANMAAPKEEYATDASEKADDGEINVDDIPF